MRRELMEETSLAYTSDHEDSRDETESGSLRPGNRRPDCRRSLPGLEPIGERRWEHGEVSGDVHPHSFAHGIQRERGYGNSLAGDACAPRAEGYDSRQE